MSNLLFLLFFTSILGYKSPPKNQLKKWAGKGIKKKEEEEEDILSYSSFSRHSGSYNKDIWFKCQNFANQNAQIRVFLVKNHIHRYESCLITKSKRKKKKKIF